jgi:uncharacterized protein GlcG (DUF336 family)
VAAQPTKSGSLSHVANFEGSCGFRSRHRSLSASRRTRHRHTEKHNAGLAQTIANAAIAQCRSMGYKISVTVVDREGLPLVMLRDDGAGLSTPEGSDRKAYTARSFSQPSADFVKRLQDRPDSVGSRHYSRILALAGGLPIKVGDEIVGAGGVSGTPGKDDDCSQAGIDKVADQLK